MVEAERDRRERRPQGGAAVMAAAAAALVLCIAAVALISQSNDNTNESVSLAQSGISSQLKNAESFFSKAAPVPDVRSSGSSSAPVKAAAGGTGLGLHGMSQKQFESVVDREVTSKVAQVLLQTMKPLKHVLKEQQHKIFELEHKHGAEEKAEKRIATRLASDLKTGLMSHLKEDVDVELHRKLTPKLLLKAEKSKKALQAKHSTYANHHHSAHSQDVRSAVKHSMSNALSGLSTHAQRAKHATGRGQKHENVKGAVGDSKKRKCDPVAGLYSSGVVSWC